MCGICQDLPDGRVLSCQAGHSFCQHCLEKALLNDHRCPMCRGQVTRPPARNLLQEGLIARKSAPCQWCNSQQTRGTLAAHQDRCSKRPASCVGRCTWKGTLGMQASHRSICVPYQVAQEVQVQIAAMREQYRGEFGRLREQLRILVCSTLQGIQVGCVPARAPAPVSTRTPSKRSAHMQVANTAAIRSRSTSTSRSRSRGRSGMQLRRLGESSVQVSCIQA